MRIAEILDGRAVRSPHSSSRQRCRRCAAVRVARSRAVRSRGWRQTRGAWRPQARATARAEAKVGSDRTERIALDLRWICANCCERTFRLTIHRNRAQRVGSTCPLRIKFAATLVQQACRLPIHHPLAKCLSLALRVEDAAQNPFRKLARLVRGDAARGQAARHRHPRRRRHLGRNPSLQVAGARPPPWLRGERAVVGAGAVVGSGAVVGDRLKDAVRARRVERLGAGRRRCPRRRRFRQLAACERCALSEIINLRRRECVPIPHLRSQNSAIMRSSERHSEALRGSPIHSEAAPRHLRHSEAAPHGTRTFSAVSAGTESMSLR